MPIAIYWRSKVPLGAERLWAPGVETPPPPRRTPPPTSSAASATSQAPPRSAATTIATGARQLPLSCDLALPEIHHARLKARRHAHYPRDHHTILPEARQPAVAHCAILSRRPPLTEPASNRFVSSKGHCEGEERASSTVHYARPHSSPPTHLPPRVTLFWHRHSLKRRSRHSLTPHHQMGHKHLLGR